MFEEFCPAHGSRVLLTTSRIEAIHNTPDGVVVVWRCWCGHLGRTDRRDHREHRDHHPSSLPRAS